MKSSCSSKILRYWIQVLREGELDFYFTEFNGNKTEIVSKTYNEIWEIFKQLSFEEFRHADDQIIEEDKSAGEIHFLNIHWPGHERSWTTSDVVRLVPANEDK